METQIWRLETGDSALIATAIHAGGSMRAELWDYLALDSNTKQREEDPYTDLWTEVVPNRVIVDTSRFEVDLNRTRDKAVYLKPEDAWGLRVWSRDLPKQMMESSLAEYDGFYTAMAELFTDIQAKYGCFVVFDLHSYNHRRGGPEAPVASPRENPDVNVGTSTMFDRTRFAPVIESFIGALSETELPTGRLDVRENVKFRGGNFARWTHARFPDSACVLSVEFKKFFMDEWTGKVDTYLMDTIRNSLASSVAPVLHALQTI